MNVMFCYRLIVPIADGSVAKAGLANTAVIAVMHGTVRLNIRAEKRLCNTFLTKPGLIGGGLTAH